MDLEFHDQIEINYGTNVNLEKTINSKFAKNIIDLDIVIVRPKFQLCLDKENYLLDFGDVYVCQSKQLQFAIRNVSKTECAWLLIQGI